MAEVNPQECLETLESLTHQKGPVNQVLMHVLFSRVSDHAIELLRAARHDPFHPSVKQELRKMGERMLARAQDAKQELLSR